MRKNNSTNVARFLYENVICRHSIFQKLIYDGDLENKNIVAILVKRYSIKRIIVSAYYLIVNSIVEREYCLIINSLLKITSRGRGG